MTGKNIEIGPEEINEITDSLFNVYAKNKNYITKSECKKILDDLFKSLFEHRLKGKSFDCIYSNIKKNENGKIDKEDFEDITRSIIVSFNVNMMINCSSFTDKICIKIGKKLLPVYYYVKKE
jgi:Ca2+-binding EF-hand superfamily protein